MNTDLNLKMYYVHVYSGDSETPFATFVFPCGVVLKNTGVDRVRIGYSLVGTGVGLGR